MVKQHEIRAPKGARKNTKRLGRGNGSGSGNYSGRGMKGQKSRSGSGPVSGFEGGQLPLIKRLPTRRGFTNIFRKEIEIVNINQLAGLDVKGPITPEAMKEKGLIRKVDSVKILGNGELSGAVIVHAQKFSRSAVAKIEKSGGKAVTI